MAGAWSPKAGREPGLDISKCWRGRGFGLHGELLILVGS